MRDETLVTSQLGMGFLFIGELVGEWSVTVSCVISCCLAVITVNLLCTVSSIIAGDKFAWKDWQPRMDAPLS